MNHYSFRSDDVTRINLSRAVKFVPRFGPKVLQSKRRYATIYI